VDTSDAVELIRGAIGRRTGTWADLGAGEGTFTRALVELLGPKSRIYAVDRDARALAKLERWSTREAPNVIPIAADFAATPALRAIPEASLDGVLCANALHFVADPTAVLRHIATWLRPGGRLVLVEYDRRRGNPWVPHPIPLERLPATLEPAGFSDPIVTATQPSAYGGILYVAVAERLVGAS
jgi:ubiquinone/menaquinone biosynthesis C-methylase UbiE